MTDDNSVSEEDVVVQTEDGERYESLSVNKSGESDDDN